MFILQQGHTCFRGDFSSSDVRKRHPHKYGFKVSYTETQDSNDEIQRISALTNTF